MALISLFELIQAEEQHRDHAVVEQVFADWTDGPLAHLPSGFFPASAAWLACAAIAHNLLRAAGSLASLSYGKARGARLASARGALPRPRMCRTRRWCTAAGSRWRAPALALPGRGRSLRCRRGGRRTGAGSGRGTSW
jgi:hypothetical protein